MPRWQAERAMEREQAALDRDFEDGILSDAEYRQRSQALLRDLRDACQADCDAAQEAVRDEWGW